jgi:hypothetical protein
MIFGRYFGRASMTNVVIVRTGATATTIGTNLYFIDSWLDDFPRRVEKITTAIERRRIRFQQIHAMAEPCVENVPRPTSVLNAGLMIRRMRAPTGLARGRA